MTPPAVVIAAGLGKRLRPLTERYAKPVLPIDGRPVIALLMRELAGADCPRVTVVVGHLGGIADQGPVGGLDQGVAPVQGGCW